MSQTVNRSAVLIQLLEYCEPACARDPVAFLEYDADVRTCPSDPASTFEAMQERFSADELVASGVARRIEGQLIELTPGLAAPEGLLVALRDAETGEPYDLLTPVGSLSQELPVLASLRDGHTQGCLDDGDGDLLAAFSVEDAAVLRACGLPATLAHGLDKLPLDQVAHFCEQFGLRTNAGRRASDRDSLSNRDAASTSRHGQPASEPPAAEPGELGRPPFVDPAVYGPRPAAPSDAGTSTAQLVLLAWSPADLDASVPGRFQAIADRFTLLERFMGVELDELGLWQPDEEDLERLRFVAESGCAGIFRDGMLDCAEDIAGGLADSSSQCAVSVRPPADYTTALSRLHEADSRDQFVGLDHRKRAWNDLQAALNQQLISPVRELAMSTTNPVHRALLMSIAELSFVFHTQSTLVSEKLSRRIDECGVDHVEPLAAEDLKSLLLMADTLIRTAKATEQCNPHGTTIVHTRSIGSRTIPRLPHCD